MCQAQTNDDDSSKLLTLISKSICGRFDGKPQRCTAAMPAPNGRIELDFALESSEDGRRTLMITIPSFEELRAADGCMEDICVASTSEDGLDDGYVARVTMDETDSFVTLRIDHAVRLQFWMSADLSPVYFSD